MRTNLKLIVSCLVFLTLTLTGCNQLRFAPTEIQKQNAYLHHRTLEATAQQSQQEKTSPTLQSLTTHAVEQSEAILAYYGLPQEIPPSKTTDELLSPANTQLTQNARTQAIQRPDPWDLADGLLEIAIACAGVVGGVVGTRATRALQLAQKKSQALREIISGNELFKQQNPQSADAFKQAQIRQTPTTREIVAATK